MDVLVIPGGIISHPVTEGSCATSGGHSRPICDPIAIEFAANKVGNMRVHPELLVEFDDFDTTLDQTFHLALGSIEARFIQAVGKCGGGKLVWI